MGFSGRKHILQIGDVV